jgi:HUS1 checkpoint protein
MFSEITEIVMKLAKKDGHPLLVFEITAKTHTEKETKVTHDVRIEVMKPTDVELLQEPMCPKPDVGTPSLSQSVD